ncbi:MAG: hypothetical protein H0X30_09950 [Anaerolineae bacterium]|nr:hypothetical protein [Anaerolineae bacterium]
MICVRIVWWIFSRGILWGAILGAVLGTVFSPLAGTIFGFFYGAGIGLVVGGIDAFALGATAHFFMDMNRPARIVPWLRLIAVVLTFISAYICTDLLMNHLPPFAQIVALIAIIPAYILTPRFVDYAVRIQQVKPPEPTNTLIQTPTKLAQ